MPDGLIVSKTVKKLRLEEHTYIHSIGGYLNLLESDELQNDRNRAIIDAFSREHEETWLGNVNFYGATRLAIINNTNQPLIKYEGQNIYNFEYTFCVHYDEILCALIRKWNQGTDIVVLHNILNRIAELGGEHFVWS